MNDSPQFQHQQIRLPLNTVIDQKLISKIHKQVKKQNSIIGVWSDKQNLIYAQFIENNPFQFQTAEKRRKFKVFQRMALKLPNRTAIQCRSHNQKMVKLAGSIMKVPQYIKKRLNSQGRKEDQPIQIYDEQKELTKEKEIDQIFERKDEKKQKNLKGMEGGGFKLPLKLCIQIIIDRIEEYC